MLEIVLKVSFVIAIALLFYKLVLQQESFFSTNRFYFIGCMVLAFLLPYAALPELISHQGYLDKILQSETSLPVNPRNDQVYKADSNKGSTTGNNNISNQTVDQEDEPVVSKQPQTVVANINWLLVLYFFGVIIFSLNLLFQLGNILLLVAKSKDKISDGDYVIVNTPHKQAPCSFFKYIFVHPNDYDFETYEQILAHEKIHVRLKHTWDLLIAELAVIILWFNPLVWFYKREIEKNIEFQTDSILLEKEQISKARYQMNLLQIATPYKPLTITTNYNQSLLKQRIEMMNAKKSTVNRYWKYAFTVPMFVGAVLFLNEPVTSQDFRKNVANAIATPEGQAIPSPESIPSQETIPSPQVSINPTIDVRPTSRIRMNYGGNEDMSHGYFYSYSSDNEYCIEFKGVRSSGNNFRNWNFSNCFDKKLFEKKETELYVLTRETGTMKLYGALEQEVSQGKYEFIKDNSFEQYLAKNNLKSEDQNFLFHLFQANVDRKYVDFIKSKFNTITPDQFFAMAIHEVDKSYIEDMEKAGFKNINVDKLIAAKIHGVTPSTAKEMQALGFGDMGLDKLIELKIHGITPAYAEELKSAGFKDLTLNQIISAKIHGVSPASIKEMKNLGFGDLSMDKMIELHIHGISADYIQQLKSAGLKDINLDQVVQAKIHGVNAASVKQMQDLGFGNLEINKIIQLEIHGVDAVYVQELKNAGVQDLSIDKVMEARIHGVSGATIKEMRDLGYGDLSINKIIELRIHGVDPVFVQDLKSAGFKDLTLDQVLQARIHGLDGRYIKEIQNLGFKNVSFDQFLEARMHGVDAIYINDLKKAGFTNLTLDSIITARIHGVDGAFVQEAKSNGYNLKTLEEYTKIKIHGMVIRNPN
jgi:beta-lactamase regulating signal transducer with metallopeptidase domain/predicted metallopeptidase